MPVTRGSVEATTVVNPILLYQIIELDIAGTRLAPVGLSAEQNGCAEAEGASGVVWTVIATDVAKLSQLLVVWVT